MQRLCTLIIFSFLIINLFSQTQIDSIENSLKGQRLEEKYHELNKIFLDYKYNQPEMALEVAQLAYDFAEKIDNDTAILQPLINIALAHYYASRYDSVLYFLDQVDDICNSDRYKKATEIKAYKAQSKNIRGIILYRKTEFDLAIEKYLEAEKIYMEIGDSSGAAKAYNNIAVIYRKLEQYKNAIKFYKKSIKIHEARNDSINLGISYNNVAISYGKLKKNKFLIYYTRKSIEINEKLDNFRILSTNYHTLGNYYSRNKKFDLAVKNLNHSLYLKKKIEYIYGYSLTYNSLGEVYFKMKDYKTSRKYVDSSYTISYANNDKDILINNYELYTRLDSAEKKFESAYFNLFNYMRLKDSIYQGEVTEKINLLENKYKDQQIRIRDLQITGSKEKIKRQQTVIYAFILGFILILISTILIILQNKKIREKNSILNEQNFEINQQKEEIITQRDDIKLKSEKIETQNLDIKASISYAARIQQVLLTHKNIFNKLIPKNFIFFKPRDIVSGDFYWAKEISKNKVAYTVADCTGHGVPGAFMSILGITLLNEIVSRENIKNTDEFSAASILDELRRKVKEALNQEDINSETQDGMDMSLCIVDLQKMELNFAGANNPIFLIRNNELKEFKADRMPIGISYGKKKDFTNHKIDLQKSDIIYSFSDGFVDQFGGENNQKYYKANFKKLLLSLQNKTLEEQKKAIEIEFNNWTKKGRYEQIDDILIIAVKI